MRKKNKQHQEVGHFFVCDKQLDVTRPSPRRWGLGTRLQHSSSDIVGIWRTLQIAYLCIFGCNVIEGELVQVSEHDNKNITPAVKNKRRNSLATNETKGSLSDGGILFDVAIKLQLV